MDVNVTDHLRFFWVFKHPGCGECKKRELPLALNSALEMSAVSDN